MFKFCKQNVSFSLTRTFICPQAVSRLARLLSQFKCRLKWSKVVFVHALCSQFPFAMLSDCCLHKGFAWDLLQWADVKVYVLYRAAQCPARKHCTACLGSICLHGGSTLPAHRNTSSCHILSEIISFIFWTKPTRLQNTEFSWIFKLLLNISLVFQMMDLFLTSYLPPLHSPKHDEIDDLNI